MAAGGGANSILALKPTTGEWQRFFLTGTCDQVYAMVLSPDEERVYASASWREVEGAAAHVEFRLLVFDLNEREEIVQLSSPHLEWDAALAVSPDGKWLASGGSSGALLLWNTERLECERVLREKGGSISSLLWHPDGRRLFVSTPPPADQLDEALARAERDYAVSALDVRANRVVGGLVGHTKPVTRVLLSSDERRIFTASEDGTIRVWDSVSLKPLGTLDAGSGGVRALAVSPDGETLYSGGYDLELHAWNVEWFLMAPDERLRKLEGDAGLTLDGTRVLPNGRAPSLVPR